MRWIAASAALHLALLAFLKAPAASGHAQVPVQLALRPAAPVVAPVAKERAVRSAGPARAAHAAVARVEAPQPVQTNDGGGVLPRGPRTESPQTVSIPPLWGLTTGKEVLKDETETERVTRVVEETVEAAVVAQDTRTGARGDARLMRHAMQGTFEPRAEWVQWLPGSTQAKQRLQENQLDTTRVSSRDIYAKAMTPGQKSKTDGLIEMGDPCKFSHEIGRLEIVARVTGKLVRLRKRSGDTDFDTYAEGVIRAAAEAEKKKEPDEPDTEWSEWALSQIVYDWHAGGCFEPGLKLPGKLIAPGVTYVSEVKLLAVRYVRNRNRSSGY